MNVSLLKYSLKSKLLRQRGWRLHSPRWLESWELANDLPSEGGEGESLAAAQINHTHPLHIITSHQDATFNTGTPLSAYIHSEKVPPIHPQGTLFKHPGWQEKWECKTLTWNLSPPSFHICYPCKKQFDFEVCWALWASLCNTLKPES